VSGIFGKIAKRGQYCILKCNPLILFVFWGGVSRLTLTTLTTKGVDTHANGRKEKDKEEGETRRQEEDDEAPEEEIVIHFARIL